MKKLCLPVKPQLGGGMFTFVRNFRKYLKSINYSWTDKIEDDYDVLMVCAWHPDYEAIMEAKKRNKKLKIIHRVDGSGRDYGRVDDCDDRLQKINKIVNQTIFQSKYSKFATTKKYKLISVDGPIIYNMVDTEVFTLEGEKMKRFGDVPHICAVSWSMNEKKGAGDIIEIARKNPGIIFVLCGRYQLKYDLTNVFQVGTRRAVQIAEVMRSCDAFVHMAENDPCPNVVIEALASGLPVYYKDSGGTGELVGDCGFPVDIENFGKVFGVRTKTFEKKIRKRAIDLFSIEKIGRQYIDTIEGI